MKIIDLLNKIANGEEVPYEIKYNGRLYKWCRDIGDYRIDGCAECLIIKSIFGTFDCCGKHNSLYNMLFDTVEIIEEDKKIPEKLDVISWDKCIHGVTHKEKELAIEINKTQELLNQVIDYLKSKGE